MQANVNAPRKRVALPVVQVLDPLPLSTYSMCRFLAPGVSGPCFHPTAYAPPRVVYGLSRASPKSFFPHHLAAISSAIVCADARSIRNHAASLATQLSHGMI